MLLVSFAAGLLVLKRTLCCGLPNALLSAGIGALFGTATELFSPSEYDTVTVPVAILVVLLVLKMV